MYHIIRKIQSTSTKYRSYLNYCKMSGYYTLESLNRYIFRVNRNMHSAAKNLQASCVKEEKSSKLKNKLSCLRSVRRCKKDTSNPPSREEEPILKTSALFTIDSLLFYALTRIVSQSFHSPDILSCLNFQDGSSFRLLLVEDGGGGGDIQEKLRGQKLSGKYERARLICGRP